MFVYMRNFSFVTKEKKKKEASTCCLFILKLKSEKTKKKQKERKQNALGKEYFYLLVFHILVEIKISNIHKGFFNIFNSDPRKIFVKFCSFIVYIFLLFIIRNIYFAQTGLNPHRL